MHFSVAKELVRILEDKKTTWGRNEKQKFGECYKKGEEVTRGLLQSPLGAKEMFEVKRTKTWDKCFIEVLDVFVGSVEVFKTYQRKPYH